MVAGMSILLGGAAGRLCPAAGSGQAHARAATIGLPWRPRPRRAAHDLGGAMNAAELLVKCLENEGVDYIFGIPGEENLDIMDALLDSRITFVTVRHEQGAAFMADVYGRLTGRA